MMTVSVRGRIAERFVLEAELLELGDPVVVHLLAVLDVAGVSTYVEALSVPHPANDAAGNHEYPYTCDELDDLLGLRGERCVHHGCFLTRGRYLPKNISTWRGSRQAKYYYINIITIMSQSI